MLSVTEQQNPAPLVLVDRPSAHVALVTLNRPERMNSMAFDVMVPLKSALDELSYDNSVRAIVLTGAGRGFSSGADHKSAGAVPHVDGLTRPTYALRSMEVLDDLFFDKLGLHIIEPVSKVVKVKRVIPKPKFDKKKMTASHQKEDYKKQKAERLKKLNDSVIKEEKEAA